MAEQKNDETNMVNVPADVLQSLIAEITNLRMESSETKKLLASVQEKLNTVLQSADPPPARGAFDVFPGLPLELRQKIWDAALSIPRIVGSSLVAPDTNSEEKVLSPTTPNSPLLLVNTESRDRAMKILVCLTENEDRRVPLLYINPKVDTLWIVNYYCRRTRDHPIARALFESENFTKLAIPHETWKKVLYQHTKEEIVDLVIQFRKKGIEEITLVIGEKATAKCSDIAFIVPREILNWHGVHGWTDDIQAYGGVEELKNDRYVNGLAILARNICMERAGLTRGSPTDSPNEKHNIMVMWSNGLWKPPRFTFREATTRKELAMLSEGI